MSGFAGELLDFLLPKFDDPLQVSFMLIIVLMIAGTMASAHRAARPASWEKKWNRGTPDRDDDDLDIEHGSVTDLWHAVATSPEKLAEVMPGMLLVVGLLGTFLGLGMALDHASSILGQSNAVADSMGDLLGLLKGLGTKFKTSTWGIVGFLLLKIWSELTRFDEKRLIWVIDKVKGELDRRASERRAAEEGKQKELFDRMSAASAHIVVGISDAVTKVGERLIQNLDNLRSTFDHRFERVDASLQRSHTEMRSLVLSSAGKAHDVLVEIKVAQQSSNEVLTGFSQGTQDIIRQMAVAAEGMASGAASVSTAAEGLEKVVQAFGIEFKQVLDNVRKDLGSAIDTMSTRSAAAMAEGSTKLENATREISMAVSTLSANVESTMGQVATSVNDALDTQKSATNAFTETTQTLNVHVETTTNTTKELGGNITSGLTAISKANRDMAIFATSFESKLKELLKGIASREDSNVLPAILKEVQDLHRALVPPVQETPQYMLSVSEGKAP